MQSLRQYADAFSRQQSFGRTRLHCLTILVALMAGLVLFGNTATAQWTQNQTSPAETRGADGVGPDSVNLNNGSVNISIPLATVKGRGNVSHTIATPSLPKISVNSTYEPYFEANTVTVKFDSGFVEEYDGRYLYTAYGPGVLVWRKSINVEPVAGYPTQTNWLTRLVFKTPDGGEIYLRDELNDGRPAPFPGFGYNGNRGTVFTSYDGSRVKFVCETAMAENYQPPVTGFLYFPDGTRMRVVNGLIQYKEDTNGNRITFTYSPVYSGAFGYAFRVTKITDSLGRDTLIEYDVNDVQPFGLCDRITVKGFGGANRVIRVSKKPLNQSYRADIAALSQKFPYYTGNSYFFDSASGSPVFNKVWLPNSTSYSIEYNDYGLPARVVLPSGGAAEYDYDSFTGEFPRQVGINETQGDTLWAPRATERRVYPNGTGQFSNRTTYSIPRQNGVLVTNYVQVDQYDSSSVLLGRSRHYHLGEYNQAQTCYNFTPYPSSLAGKEFKTETFDSDGTTLLNRTTNTWNAGTFNWQPAQSWQNCMPTTKDPTLSLSQKEIFQPGNPTPLVSKTEYFHNTDLNLTQTREYGFGMGAPGNLFRRTEALFLVDDFMAYPNTSAYRARHLIALPTLVKVLDAAGNIQSQTMTKYDEATYPILTYAGATVGWQDPGTTVRGNVTSVLKWSKTDNTWIQTSNQFDQFGNQVKAVDALGRAVEVEFSPTYQYGFRTKITTPSPDPTGWRGSSQGFTTTSAFDFFSGAVISTTDANGNTTTFQYNDPMDRLTRTDFPDGSWSTQEFGDNPGNLFRRAEASFDSTKTIKTESFMDGLGRNYENRQYESATDFVSVRAEFDALGRVKRTSKPFRSGEAPVWTTNTYDALGRVVNITLPDGATRATNFNLNKITVTDPAGRKRSAESDAFGNTTKVIEDDKPGGFQYETVYQYDVLGNLCKVTQGGQSRFFAYDSLSRLIYVKHPEQVSNSAFVYSDPVTGNTQWSERYEYAFNGNLLKRHDARNVPNTQTPVQATFTYDRLNRLTDVTYNDGTATRSSSYDSAVNGKGRLRATWIDMGVSEAERTKRNIHTHFDNYDVMGRPLNKFTEFWKNGTWDWVGSYGVGRTYNLGGVVVSQTLPSGHTVTNSFDSAGRLSSVAGTLGDGQSRTYTSGIQYTSSGLIAKEQFGTLTSLWLNRRYNVRDQLGDLRLGNDDQNWGWNRGCWQWYYGGGFLEGSATNNGNVTSHRTLVQSTTAPGQEAWDFTTYYAYDGLNRLTAASEVYWDPSTPHTGSWSKSYSYDRWGNRSAFRYNGVTLSPDTATNRLVASNNGLTYDAAGNQTFDSVTGNGNRWFDAENRLIKADASNGLNEYVYDPAGMRVKTKVGRADELWMVYGLDGELLAEYAPNTAKTQPLREYGYRGGELMVVADPADCKWLVLDHLGSTRAVIGKSGSLADTKRRDFMPYGEELQAGQYFRTIAKGYEGAVPSNPREKFATYERDDETGLDFAQARYYSSIQGRFTSVDPLLASGSVGNPKTWNRFTYVLNNPMKLIDPTGLYMAHTGTDGADPYNPEFDIIEAQKKKGSGGASRSLNAWYIHWDPEHGTDRKWFKDGEKIPDGWTKITDPNDFTYRAVNGRTVILNPNDNGWRYQNDTADYYQFSFSVPFVGVGVTGDRYGNLYKSVSAGAGVPDFAGSLFAKPIIRNLDNPLSPEELSSQIEGVSCSFTGPCFEVTGSGTGSEKQWKFGPGSPQATGSLSYTKRTSKGGIALALFLPIPFFLPNPIDQYLTPSLKKPTPPK